MALRYGTLDEVAAVSVLDEATEIAPVAQGRRSLLIQNNGSEDVFLGPDDVTTSTGFVLEPGSTFVDDMTTSAWFGIVVTGPVDVRIVVVK